MHSLKKLISTLCLMLTLSVSSAFAEVWTDEIQEVFDTSLGGKRISLGIGSNDFMCIAVFFDESRYELNMAGCDISEYDKLKKATFECKILMKKASTLQEYEKKNIYAQIVEKLKFLAPITIIEEEHSMTDEFGFVKESLYISQSVVSNSPDSAHLMNSALPLGLTEMLRYIILLPDNCRSMMAPSSQFF